MGGKIRVAFIKFGGLSAGGTERFLQTISANLPVDEFIVDYFYTHSAPYMGSNYVHADTDPYRLEYLQNSNVNLKEVKVQFKDVRVPTHDWLGTNLWEIFNEDDYDLIISGRAGHPEFPFNKITQTPIINILTLVAGVDNQPNVAKSIHITAWAGEEWVKAGGNRDKLEIVPVFQEMPNPPFTNLKNELKLNGKFIYGFHQRNDNNIFSEVPLLAYKEIESYDTYFLMLGGGAKYGEQAKRLGLINFKQLPHSGDSNKIHEFVETLDVFTHGRNDGETFGAVFTEAMHHKKPIISHLAKSNGHVSVIGPGGKVFSRGDIKGYSDEMVKLKMDSEYYDKLGKLGYEHFNVNFSLGSQIYKFITMIKDILK